MAFFSDCNLHRWTEDPILQAYKFCSVFRVSDRGCQFLISDIIQKGSTKHEDIVFRVLLYNIFTRIETYKLLEGELGPSTWETYDRSKYDRVLQRAMDRGITVYTGAFQKPAPSLGHTTAFRNHLSLLEVMMGVDITGQLARCRYMRDAFDLINQFPGMGDFMAFQLLLDLSYTPVINFGENDFVIAGVGARKGIEKCFKGKITGIEEAIIRWMCDSQDEMFQMLDLEPVLLDTGNGKTRKMTLVDVEHTLCEVQKYVRIVSGPGQETGWGKKFKPTSDLGNIVIPKAWSCKERMKIRIATGHHERAPKRYVVDSVLEKRVNEDGDVEYLVDWVGYTAKDRTWEPEKVLKEDAPLAVEEFEDQRAKEDGNTWW